MFINAIHKYVLDLCRFFAIINYNIYFMSDRLELLMIFKILSSDTPEYFIQNMEFISKHLVRSFILSELKKSTIKKSDKLKIISPKWQSTESFKNASEPIINEIYAIQLKKVLNLIKSENTDKIDPKDVKKVNSNFVTV